MTGTQMPRVDALLEGALARAESKAKEALSKIEEREAKHQRRAAEEAAECARVRAAIQARYEQHIGPARAGLGALMAFAHTETVQQLITHHRGPFRKAQGGQIAEFKFFEIPVCWDYDGRDHNARDMHNEDAWVRIFLRAEGIYLDYGYQEESNDCFLFSDEMVLASDELRELIWTASEPAELGILPSEEDWVYWCAVPHQGVVQVIARVLIDCADPDKFEAYCTAALR